MKKQPIEPSDIEQNSSATIIDRLKEALLSLRSCYELSALLIQEHCTPAEKSQICQFVLDNDALFESLVPHLAAVRHITDTFSDTNTASSTEDKILSKLLNSKESFAKYFTNYYFFSELYKLFVANDLSMDKALARSHDMMTRLEKTPSVELFHKFKVYLPQLISARPAMQEQLLAWAEKSGLVRSDDEIAIILGELATINEEMAESARKKAAEGERKKMAQKVGARFYPRAMHSSVPNLRRVELHTIVSMLGPRDSDIHKALILLKSGASLEARSVFGETPLISAAIAGNTLMTLLLLSWGAKVNVADQDGYKPKLFKLFYSCDHEYDEGGCIPLKLMMDNPMRELLSKIEALENSHLSPETDLYSFDQIKADLLSMMGDKAFQNAKPLAALCGYVFKNVVEAEQKNVLEFFKANCDVNIEKEPYLLESMGIECVASEEKMVNQNLATLSAYRAQLHIDRPAQESLTDIMSQISTALGKK